MKEELKEIKDTIEQVFSITLSRASDDCIADLHSAYTTEKESTSRCLIKATRKGMTLS